MNVVEQEVVSERPVRPRAKMGLGSALIGHEEEELVLRVIRSKRLFRYAYDLPPEEQGEMAATLEREIREAFAVKYALGVTSGTAALEVALGAMGVGPGDEVIVAAWSWVSCFTAIVRLGARPVLAEIDESFCLSPGEIARLSTPQTKAVLVVHYQGVAAKMDQIMKEAKSRGLLVLEDCAESPGALYKGQRVGSIGHMGIYSFQAQKTITSGEGGAVVTNDPCLYERAVRMHDLGQVRAHHALFIKPHLGGFCGAQYRMNELTAAVALAQFRKVDKIRNHCRGIRDRIMSRIGKLSKLQFRYIPDTTGDSGIEIYFCLPNSELAREFTNKLDERNVNCSKMTGTYCQYEREYCLKRQAHAPGASPFRDFEEWPAKGYRAEDFPVTESLVHRFVTLPLGYLYTDEDADYIAGCVEDIYKKLEW